jgi:hypothetical protein
MAHEKTFPPGVLTLVCVLSWSVVFAAVVATAVVASNDTATGAYFDSLIPGVLFGLPAVIGVAEARRALPKQTAGAGYELFGLLCLFSSWLMLVGYAMPTCHERLTLLGLLASLCFLLSTVGKGVHSAMVVVRHRKKTSPPSKAQERGEGNIAIDVINALSLVGQMLTIVGVAHVGVGFAGPALFFISPAETVGVAALVVASFCRRSHVQNTILLEIFGTLCMMTTSWRVFSVGFALPHCLFLLMVACKFPCLAVQRAREQRWTQITLAGLGLFLVGCVPLVYLVTRYASLSGWL